MQDPSVTIQELLRENSLLLQKNRELEESNLDRRRTGEALQESEARYRRMVEGLTDYQYRVRIENGQAVETTHSVACVMVTGYRAEEFAADPHLWIRMVVPEDCELVIKRVEQIMEGHDILPIEHRIIRKDGEVRWVSDKIVPCRDNSGVLISYDGVVSDITEHKRLEDELLRANKLESLGVLAGGIAHDFNNLMGIVQGYIEIALLELPSDHAASQRLLSAMRSLEQTKDLTSRLITFSSGGGPIVESCDVREIIRNAVFSTVKGTAVRVQFDFTANLWSPEIDELQMKQCFYHLTMNSVEAMPNGGKLTIRAKNVQISPGEVLDLREGPYLKIIFTDEGIGIPEESLTKVFDPYFTTKGMGARKGMGLGLSVCYSILKKHHGHISVASKEGQGASFTLYLPVRDTQS